MDATDPTLLAQMATSRPTRLAFGVLVVVVVVLVSIGAFAAGAVHATDKRFEAIERAIEMDRGASKGRSDRDEWTRRDVFEQLTEMKANQQAMGVMLLDVRDEVKAIRDAVAPLPKGSDRK